MFSVHEIIDIAVQLEKNGEKIYRNAQKLTNDISLKDLLGWIAAEEITHAEWLTELRSDLEQDEDHHLVTEMSQALVTDFVGERAFSLDEVNFSQIEDTKGLIKIFIGFEEDTIIFLETLKSFITDEETIEKLDQIISEEKVHIEKFQELLPGISEE